MTHKEVIRMLSDALTEARIEVATRHYLEYTGKIPKNTMADAFREVQKYIGTKGEVPGE